MRLTNKLLLIGFVVASLLLVCGGSYYYSVSTSENRSKQLMGVYVGTALNLEGIYAQGLQTEQAIRNIVLNPADEKAVANFSRALSEFDQLYTRTLETAKGLDVATQLAQARPLWDKGVAIKRNIEEHARSGNIPAAMTLLVKEETPAWREFKDLILKLQKIARQDMQQQLAISNSKNMKSFWFTTILLVVTSGVVLVVLLLFARDLLRRLNRFSDQLQDLATGDGDLTQRIEISGRDEIATMAASFNQAWDKLDHMIAQVVEHATLVETFSGQVAIETQKTVRSSREIASQSIAVATASEEMSATSNDIAHNCGMAADSARGTCDVAERGKVIVQKTIDRMSSLKTEVQSSSEVIERLGSSSERIGQIADTIQDIADQTNLLALNAAIEAARAGDMGRGFAVVADEVRALAERTAKATKEISEMIRSIQIETGAAVSAMQRSANEVDRGVVEAHESGSALGNIIDQVNTVTVQMSQIATAAEEQTATTVEIVNNIGKISQAVSDFDAASGVVNGKVRHLLQLSEELKKQATVFKANVSPLLMLDTAKSDHIMFVNRLERCLENHEHLTPESLGDHTTCRFGKWYVGSGQQLCGTAPSYRTINDPHERIHRLAKEAVALHNSGNRNQAEQIMQAIEDVSHEVVELLDKVKSECKR